MIKKLLIACIGIIFSITAFSQVPSAFKYQAIARDMNGTVLTDQQIGIKINIRSESTKGVSVYSETQHVKTNGFGLINLDIGRGESRTGDINNIDWGASKYFLEIEVDINGGTDYKPFGTSELLSVPYAMYAGQVSNNSRVSTEWTNDGTNIYTDETSFPGANTGIGTTGPLGKLHIYGPGLTGPNAPMLMVEHDAGFSSTFRRSANNPGNALFLLQKSRGTYGSPLVVQNGDNVGQIRMEAYDGSTFKTAGWVRVAVDGTPSPGIVPGALLFATTNNSGTVEEKMRITPSGNVGIGTTNPEWEVDVVHSGPSWIRLKSLGDYAGVVIDKGNDNDNGYMIWKIFGASKWYTGLIKNEDFSISKSYTAPDGIFYINRTSENIGVGTSNPMYKLHVNGTVNSTNYFKNGSEFNEGKWTESGSNIYYNNGKVAIGTTDPESNGLNAQNYIFNKGAVRGADQNGSFIYAEGYLGVLNPTSLGLPIVPYNVGVLGIKPNQGQNGAAVYGWNNDDNTDNYAGLFVSDGAGTNNYAVYAQATGAGDNYAGYFGGKVEVQGNSTGSDATHNVLVVQTNHTSSVDTRAIFGKSVPQSGWGYGVYGEGGWMGVYGKGSGDDYTGNSYGVYGTASGIAGTRIGVYGSASGGATNWAGYFDGDAYISSDLRIGTTTQATGYSLSVNGKIACEEVLVQDMTSWPDYVFTDDYNLLTLEELEQSIEQNKHLPGVPSAKEIVENGLHLGNMQKTLIEKVEELTLYTIEQGKMIKELKKEVETLKESNSLKK